MLLRISLLTFLTALFSLIVGSVTGSQMPVDFGRVLIFLSVVLVTASMLWITLDELHHSLKTIQPKKT